MQATYAAACLRHLRETPHTQWGCRRTLDRKIVDKHCLVTSFVLLLIRSIETVLMRLQLSRSDEYVRGWETCDELFSMHGITMLDWFASRFFSGFGHDLAPLMLACLTRMDR